MKCAGMVLKTVRRLVNSDRAMRKGDMERVKVDEREGRNCGMRSRISEWNTLPRIVRIRPELIQKDYWDFGDVSGYLLFVDDVAYGNQKTVKNSRYTTLP